MNTAREFKSCSRVLTWFMALLLSALVAGCGFGGGDSTPDVVPATTTVSGIAASGAPIVGGTVQMVCAGGTPGTAVLTGSDGSFTVTAPFTAPCVIKVSGATGAIGGPLFSVVTSSSQTRANVNQLTHMLAFLLAGGDPDTGLFQSPGSISSKITTAAVATHKATITASVIANLGAAAGIPTSFDFLEGTFTANHTGFDLVLDKIGFTAVGNTVSTVFNGAPLVAVNATTGVPSTTSLAVISTASLAAASTFGAPVTAKAVTALSFAGFPGVAATIDEATKSIAVTVPNGTNVAALVATFATTGASVKVGTTVQTSAVTANDFTAPVAYTVTAADGTTATYTVTVTVASISAKAITAYSIAGFPAVAGTIDEAAKTVAVTIPFGTDLTALVATFTITGASAKVGATVQTSTATANNFTAPVVYAVTAADGTTATYTVTVTLAANSAKAMTAYSFAGFTGATGIVNEAAKTIAVTVPNGTSVTALVATFTMTGASAKVGAAVQTSTATANNFTSPVAYIVTAADGTTATYTVTVTVAASSAKVATAFSFAGFTSSVGVINEAATPKTIAVSVPPGTNLTALVATFTTTGASVKVGTAVQTSNATPNDFTTSPVVYVVTAADGTTATYNVTVTPGLGPAPVLLGVAGNFVILTNAGITDVPSSAVTGNIGTSPITGASIGVTCAEMASGNIYEVDAAYVGNGVVTCAKPGTTGGTPNADKTFVDNAVGDMATAYTDAAGRAAGVGPNLNIGAGTVATQTLVPGTYTWGSNVTITGDLTLNGAANDVWIFQITGTLDLSPSVKILLTGGALPKNVFWQATGAVTLGTTSQFQGIILAKTSIAMNTGASINGRLFAQTAATLQSNAVTQPAP